MAEPDREITTTKAAAPRAARLRELALAHAGGFADLSTASPVDPTPQVIADALIGAIRAPGYPGTAGTPALQNAIVDWFARVRAVPGLTGANVLPTIGSKEILGLLPFMLGVGEGDTIVIPSLAYPAYAAGAEAVGATVVAEDDPASWPEGAKLIWINSPRNPDGEVLDAEALRVRLARARELGAVLVGDECYAILDAADGETIPSLLWDEVTGGDLTGVLVTYSASKQSNMAGYRAAFLAGDPAIVKQCLELRRNVGLIPPAPVQAALAAAMSDDAHVHAQREVYRARRSRLKAAIEQTGLRIVGVDAGIYIWTECEGDSWEVAELLAEAGILVTPGDMFGVAGAGHIRFALTVADAYLDQAIGWLTELGPRVR